MKRFWLLGDFLVRCSHDALTMLMLSCATRSLVGHETFNNELYINCYIGLLFLRDFLYYHILHPCYRYIYSLLTLWYILSQVMPINGSTDWVGVFLLLGILVIFQTTHNVQCTWLIGDWQSWGIMLPLSGRGLDLLQPLWYQYLRADWTVMLVEFSCHVRCW